MAKKKTAKKKTAKKKTLQGERSRSAIRSRETS